MYIPVFIGKGYRLRNRILYEHKTEIEHLSTYL